MLVLACQRRLLLPGVGAVMMTRTAQNAVAHELLESGLFGWEPDWKTLRHILDVAHCAVEATINYCNLQLVFGDAE